MKNILIIGCLITLLAGCGGGSSSSNDNGSSSTSTTPKVGDTYVYKDTTSFLGFKDSTTTTNITRKINQIGTNNSGIAVTDYYSIYNQYSLDLADVSINTIANSGCTFSTPYNLLPTPWSVGQTSNLNTTETCPSVTSNINISTQAMGYESITVDAGTFNTLKVQITKTVSGGVNITINSGAAYTESETCWYDVASGFAVKCTGTYDYSASIGSTPTGFLTLFNSGSNGKFDFTTELVSINPSTSLSLSANTTDIGKTNTSLNLIAGQTGNLISASGNYKLQVAQPANWSNSGLTDADGTQFTISSDGMSYVSSPVVGQQGTTPTNYAVTATLKSDPSKIITVNISQN